MKAKAWPISSAPEFEKIGEFEEIGKEIAKNCGGVPLAAKVRTIIIYHNMQLAPFYFYFSHVLICKLGQHLRLPHEVHHLIN